MENQLQDSEYSIIKLSSQKTPQKTENFNIFSGSNLEKGRQTRYYFQKLLHCDYSLLIFSIANIILSILYSDADYTKKTSISSACLYMQFGFLPIEIFLTIFREIVKIQLEKSQKMMDPEQTLVNSGKIFFVVLEIFILILRPYFFLNDITFETENIYDHFFFQYKVNYILVFLGFLKFFIIIRVILLNHIYMNPRSSRLCRMYGCSSDYVYAVKCLFKDSPIALIGFVFGFSVMFFAISLRIAERNLTIEYPKHFGKEYIGDMEKIQNALWLTIITMTTVGYGDFFPRTFFGRIIDVILVVWGTFIVSLMVVVLTNTLNMDQSEKRALIVLNRLEAKKLLKQAAAFLITHTCRKYLIKKKIAMNTRPLLNEEEQGKLDASFYKYLINFQNMRRTIRSMYEMDDVYEELTRQFEFINDEVSFLIGSQEDTVSSIKNYLNEAQKCKQKVENEDYCEL